MGQMGFCKNLQFPAFWGVFFFVENLRKSRFSAKICASEMLQFPGKAKISKNLRKTANLAPLVPFGLSLLFPLEKISGPEMFHKIDIRAWHVHYIQNSFGIVRGGSRASHKIIHVRGVPLFSSRFQYGRPAYQLA